MSFFLIKSGVLTSGLKQQQNRICASFEAIEENALRPPEGFKEMSDLIAYMDQVKDQELPDLTLKLKEAHRRLLFTLKFGALNEESIKLNSVTFNWPNRIISVMERHAQFMNVAKSKAAENLRERRIKFEQELEELKTQVSEFKDVGDFDETPFYFKKSQNIQKQLQTAAETITGFNKEELLLGWPLTSYPLRKQINNQLEPFIVLYTAAVNFQKSYKRWMDGSILELDAEQIEAEVDTLKREVYKIMGMLSDVTAPQNIIKHIKEKVDEFTSNLPAIRVLCNPGLRERHWEKMSAVAEQEIKPDGTTSLRRMLKMNLDSHLTTFQEISGMIGKFNERRDLTII